MKLSRSLLSAASVAILGLSLTACSSDSEGEVASSLTSATESSESSTPSESESETSETETSSEEPQPTLETTTEETTFEETPAETVEASPAVGDCSATAVLTPEEQAIGDVLSCDGYIANVGQPGTDSDGYKVWTGSSWEYATAAGFHNLTMPCYDMNSFTSMGAPESSAAAYAEDCSGTTP